MRIAALVVANAAEVTTLSARIQAWKYCFLQKVMLPETFRNSPSDAAAAYHAGLPSAQEPIEKFLSV